MITRGVRNNNPLNIRRGKDQWQGLSKKQTDPHFCQFVNMAYGFRAAFKLLTRTYYHTYRLYTISAIVRRWAPPQENDTERYIQRVASLMNYDPDMPLGIPSQAPERWMALVMAMARVECGTKSLDYMAMLEGWRMSRTS